MEVVASAAQRYPAGVLYRVNASVSAADWLIAARGSASCGDKSSLPTRPRMGRQTPAAGANSGDAHRPAERGRRPSRVARRHFAPDLAAAQLAGDAERPAVRARLAL